MSINIAIDGPAGAGKSTIAKLIARKLNYIYVDTGAMYRAMGLFFMEKGFSPDDETAINGACGEADISIAYENGSQQVYLNGKNVTDRLRTEEAGKWASATSKYSAVRAKLVEMQQKIAASENVVMDGRDIGTVVLPGADLKIYLTASAETRARRRFQELTEKGIPCKIEEIEQDIRNRDYQDMHRENSPLKKSRGCRLPGFFPYEHRRGGRDDHRISFRHGRRKTKKRDGCLDHESSSGKDRGVLLRRKAGGGYGL